MYIWVCELSKIYNIVRWVEVRYVASTAYNIYMNHTMGRTYCRSCVHWKEHLDMEDAPASWTVPRIICVKGRRYELPGPRRSRFHGTLGLSFCRSCKTCFVWLVIVKTNQIEKNKRPMCQKLQYKVSMYGDLVRIISWVVNRWPSHRSWTWVLGWCLIVSKAAA
jgi:hypothetical protein